MKVEFQIADMGGNEAAGVIALLLKTHGAFPEVQELAFDLAKTVAAQVEQAMQPGVMPPEAGHPMNEPSAGGDVEVEEAPAAEVEETTSAEVDSAGMPWDARIHAGSKATVKDGTWRKKPGVDAETLAAVEAELKASAAPLAPAAPPPPPAPAAPPPPPAPAPTAAPPAPPAPTAASAPPAPAAAPEPPVSSPAPSDDAKAPDAVRFAAAIAATTAAQKEGKLTGDDALNAVKHYVPTATSVADLLAGETAHPGAIDGYAAWVAAL